MGAAPTVICDVCCCINLLFVLYYMFAYTINNKWEGSVNVRDLTDLLLSHCHKRVLKLVMSV